MRFSGYLVVGLLIAAAVGAGATWMMKEKGPRAGWGLCALVAVVIAVAGFADWRTQAVKETPLRTYLLLALVPILVTGVLAQSLLRSPLPIWLRAVIGGAAWMAVAVVILFTSFYP